MKNYTDSLIELEEAFSASQYPIAVQKMQDFDNGTRKENLRACGDQKLVDYYDICVSHNFTNAKVQIETELKNRGMSSFINTTPLNNSNNTGSKYVYSENDFHQADAQFIKDNANDIATIIANIFGTNLSTDEQLKLCICDIILALAIKENAIATILKDALSTKVSVADIKAAINVAMSDSKIVQRLTDIRAAVTTANTIANSNYVNNQINQTSNQFDFKVNAQPGAKMYRLVTYNKDYNPPARQHLIFRKLDHSTNQYKIGIEGQPRATGWTAEPLFDSIQQAENFAKNAINLQTARNVANFKFSVVDKEIPGVVSDLSDCTLVNTVLGPAYIQNKSQYKESLAKQAIAEDIEKHNELNPKLWNEDNTLKAEVKDKINGIVKTFTDGLDDKEIRYKLDDIKLVGSNCSYNYNKDSDLDLHLVFDLDIYDDEEKQEMAEIIYDYARGNWNNNHDIYFYDIPVEIFIETNNNEQLNDEQPVQEAKQKTALKSNGVYSVMNDAWIKEPVAEDIPEVDKEAFEKELEVWEDRAKELLDDSKDNSISEDLITDTVQYGTWGAAIGGLLGGPIGAIAGAAGGAGIKLIAELIKKIKQSKADKKANLDIQDLKSTVKDLQNTIGQKNTAAILNAAEDDYHINLDKLALENLEESLIESKEEDILKARSIIADQIRGEWDADRGYTKAAADLAELKEIDTEEAQKMMLDIASEEHVHVGELETAYDAFDPKLFDELEDGHNEADEKAEPANALDYDIAEEPIADELGIENNPVEEALIEEINTPQVEEIDKFLEDIYDLRKQSIATDGEYSIGNLVFKEIRNKGYLDKLRDLKADLVSKNLSLEALEEDTTKIADHKWVNKGDEGTHGEFKTKKEADAQRKAMFANGFKK